MTLNPEMQSNVRRYLLGRLDEEARREIELGLLSNDELFAELLAAEDELVEEYLDGGLSEDERKSFERHFLSTPERYQRLQFVQTFNKYVSSQPVIAAVKPLRSGRWPAALQSRSVVLVAFVLVAISLFAGWRVFVQQSRQSDVDQGLTALNAAYREQRPLEARVSALSYAPFPQLRGDEQPRLDSTAHDRAGLALLLAARNHPGAASYHALGQFYLTDKQFDKAIEQFDKAAKLDQRDPQLFSDLGAAWLEKGKIDLNGAESGKGYEELARGLENLDKALGLNQNLLGAVFNRALCRQYMLLTEQARSDWQDYLKRDSTSPWAEEARRKLQELDELQNKRLQKKGQLSQEFFDAYQAKEDDAAWMAISHSRQRAGNSIVEPLLDDFLNLSASGGSAEAEEKLRILNYAASVEERRVGDRYTSELVRFYGSATPARREAIGQARSQMRLANKSYNLTEFEAAIGSYSRARDTFAKAGDTWEALFAEAWVGYCELRIPKVQPAIQTFQKLSEVFETRNYKSLFGQALSALSEGQANLNEFSKALEYADRSLKVAQQIEDDETAVRCLTMSGIMHNEFGDYDESLSSVILAVRVSEQNNYDLKRVWPIYSLAGLDCYLMGLPLSAVDIQHETLSIANASGMPLLKARSDDQLARFYNASGNHQEAIAALNNARSEAENVSGSSSKATVLVTTMLGLGDLYRESGKPQEAIGYYDKALDLSKQLDDLQVLLYEAHKGKLLAAMELHDDSAAQRELSTVITLFEQYRDRLTEESYRNKFFDKGQDTYDVAVDFVYSRLGNGDKAFDYAEAYRARSLFALMTTTSRVLADADRPDMNVGTGHLPLTLDEIQKRMTDRAQLLEYAVLDHRVVMWVVTKTTVESRESPIGANELAEKVQRYSQALAYQGPGADVETQAKDLYQRLIAPVRDLLDRNLQLCIIPDKSLNYLPFGALLSRAGKYLIEDYALEVAPSATVFVASSDAAKQKEQVKEERLLAVGDPRFDQVKFPGLPGLPAARREAEGVASHYRGPVILLGEAASVERVRNEMEGSDVIHFATHAVSDEQSPLLSKLLFAPDARRRGDGPSDGAMSAYSIYRMNLRRTRLVVLSACRTGIERSYRGEGAIGLARPFLAAHVPIVIASLWSVDSAATADLMTSFHAHRKMDQVSTTEALRRAQLDMLHNARSGQGSYGWAAFVVIGGYAQF
jgi:CHAT domain-containing protein